VEGLALAATDGAGGFTASRRREVVGNPIGEHTGEPWLQFGGSGRSKAYREGGSTVAQLG
jgi:hypothetical protein